jgi:uncharacterized membrane protein YedE/YeeE
MIESFQYYDNHMNDDNRAYGVYLHVNDIILCFLGGLLLGTVAAARMYIFGRVTGISGLLQNSFLPDVKASTLFDTKRLSSFLSVIGIAIGGLICNAVFNGGSFQDWTVASYPRIVIAGLLVGYGTKLGNGCTSGHGVCGISAFRIRSLVATCVFMLAGIVTAMATGSYLYLPMFKNTLQLDQASIVWAISICICVLLVIVAYFTNAHCSEFCKSCTGPHTVLVLSMEMIFGMGIGISMAVSNMSLLSATISFLDLRYWNPALAFVMMGAIAVTATAYYLIAGRMSMPIFDKQFYRPAMTQIDRSLVLGSMIFGIGWGLLGACPGPALTNIGSGNLPPVIYCICIVAGMWMEFLVSSVMQRYQCTIGIEIGNKTGEKKVVAVQEKQCGCEELAKKKEGTCDGEEHDEESKIMSV